MTDRLILDAEAYATVAHSEAGNVRKYVGGPYIGHPAEVAAFVSRYTDDPVAIAAAWLHDVIEETARSRAMLADRFGEAVAEYVWWLSDDPALKHLPRAHRVEVAAARLADAPAGVQLVKVGDIWSNSRTIAQVNPKFARIYLPEKARILQALTRAPAEPLALTRKVVIEAARSLGLELANQHVA